MKKHQKNSRNIIIAAIAAFVFLVVLYLKLNGTFDKDPTVDVMPDNCYSETLYVITDEDYRPYSFYDGEGKISGHDIELITLIANKLHMNLDLKLMNWDDAIIEVTSGKAQVLMTADYSDTFSGTDKLIKTVPTTSDDYVVYAKTRLSSVDQLYGKKIAVMKNGNVNSQIDMLQLSKYCVYYENNRKALEAVSNGEADCAVMRSTVGRVLLNEVGDKSIEPLFTIGQSFMCFGVNSENEKLVQQINQALEEFKTNGEMERLRDKWLTTFVHEYTLKEVLEIYPWIDILVVAFAALIFVGLYINKKKQEKINEEAERYQSILANMIEGYQSVYLVDPQDDSYEVIKASDVLKQYFSKNNKFKEAFSGYIDKFAYADDRNMLHNVLSPGFLSEKLKDGDSYQLEFRDIFVGRTQWHEMNVTKLGEDKMLFGFSDKTDKILLEHMNQKVVDDFLALYMVNLKNDELRFAKKFGEDLDVNEETVSFAELFKRQIEATNLSETKIFLKNISNADNLKRMLKDNNRIDQPFLWDFSESSFKWLKATIYALEKSGDEVSVVAIGISQVDELQTENIEQQEVINGIAKELDSIYYLNLETGKRKILRQEMSEETAKLAEKYKDENHYVGFAAYVKARVLPEYQETLFKLNSKEGYLDALKDRQEYKYRFESEYNDGQTIWQELVLIKMCAVNEIPENIIFGQRNVTEEVEREKNAQAELETALDMAHAASNAKTVFLNSMSHDIRTPMNAITGYTRMAKKNINDSKVVEEYLDKIDVSGQQLLSLINQVLEMSRIESGKIVLVEEHADIVENAYAMQTMCGADVDKKGIKYTLTIKDVSHRYVLTDISRTNQILTNVISNSIKYTPEGGKIDYTVEELESDKQRYGLYKFTISDTGIGMSEEFQEHLFEEFARENTSTVSHIQGTGLGMSIVKKIVDLMGGTIDVKSKLGEGTSIAITIPMKLDENVGSDIENKESSQNTNFEGKRLLLVEDNEMNREIATDILKEAGFIVEAAEDGDVSVDMVKNHKPDYYDAILMDIQMPRMNGYEATAAIRALPPEEVHIPIIALSANAFEEDKQKSFEAGMDDHVSKPIDIKKLKETLARFL